MFVFVFFFKQKTAYEMRISDWSSDVCSSDLGRSVHHGRQNSLFIRKSLDHVRHETRNHGLRKALGPIDLMFLGVGSTIGAGIYVMTGTAAATFAGPAVLISFVIAGFACAFAALCYAELASAMPVSGSSYTYAYATLGEVFAWVMGWLIDRKSVG